MKAYLNDDFKNIKILKNIIQSDTKYISSPGDTLEVIRGGLANEELVEMLNKSLDRHISSATAHLTRVSDRLIDLQIERNIEESKLQARGIKPPGKLPFPEHLIPEEEND